MNPYSGGKITGNEAAGQEFIKEKLEALGAPCRLFEPPADVYGRAGILGPEDRKFSGRPVLASEIAFSPAGKTVVLNGHIDTVDADDMDIEPFSGKVEGGRIWGRGASDDKAGLAVGLTAIKALFSVRDELKGKIIFQSVVDEECNGSGAGTLSCILNGLTGDFALVLDGGYMGLAAGCTGVLTAKIEISGSKGHAAHGGESALEKALEVKKAVDGFADRRKSVNPAANTNIGIFKAGSHPAVVPGSAEIQLNMVYDYSERSDEGNGSGVRADFEGEILSCGFKGKKPVITWVKDLPPFRTAEGGRFVSGLASAFSDVMGKPVPFRKDQAWGDASHFASLAGMPVVMFSPAAYGAAHGPAEYVSIDDMLDCAKIAAIFLYRELRS